MKTSDLNYELPEALIAQVPAERRDESRLMVLDRTDQSVRLDVFRNITEYLRAGDCLVMNDTRVIRARLKGHKASGGRVEIFLLHEEAPGVWEALVKPSAKVKPGTPVHLAAGEQAVVEDFLGHGRRRVTFAHENVVQALEAIGEIPLPPYIHRKKALALDAERYQTVYAQAPGAVAAPTAGLHYTPELLGALEAQGVSRATVTLHVGYGTFKPITAETLAEHKVDPEDFEVSEDTASLLNETRAAGGRIVAVGTTVTRVLETQFRTGRFEAGAGVTDKYIFPPYAFQAVDALQTNFHLPKSSLLALVCAFGGADFIMEAYRQAVREQFRFYSYGDTMLIV